MTLKEIGDQKNTHEVKLYLTNDYEIYKIIIDKFRKVKSKTERMEIIKQYSKLAIDYLNYDLPNDFKCYNYESLDFDYLLKMFEDCLK